MHGHHSASFLSEQPTTVFSAQGKEEGGCLGGIPRVPPGILLVPWQLSTCRGNLRRIDLCPRAVSVLWRGVSPGLQHVSNEFLSSWWSSFHTEPYITTEGHHIPSHPVLARWSRPTSLRSSHSLGVSPPPGMSWPWPCPQRTGSWFWPGRRCYSQCLSHRPSRGRLLSHRWSPWASRWEQDNREGRHPEVSISDYLTVSLSPVDPTSHRVLFTVWSDEPPRALHRLIMDARWPWHSTPGLTSLRSSERAPKARRFRGWAWRCGPPRALRSSWCTASAWLR